MDSSGYSTTWESRSSQRCKFQEIVWLLSSTTLRSSTTLLQTWSGLNVPNRITVSLHDDLRRSWGVAGLQHDIDRLHIAGSCPESQMRVIYLDELSIQTISTGSQSLVRINVWQRLVSRALTRRTRSVHRFAELTSSRGCLRNLGIPWYLSWSLVIEVLPLRVVTTN